MFMDVKSRHQTGFTLIESIIAIILLGFAMLTLASFLFPQAEKSAQSHYQVRGSVLAQSMLNEILARNFDHKSDSDGGRYRCGEPDADGNANPCTTNMGTDGESSAGEYNDVDDYVGCWFTSTSSQARCTSTAQHPLSDILGQAITTEYNNFLIEVAVNYVTNSDIVDSQTLMKRVTVTVIFGNYGELTMVGYRGNY